MKDNTHPSASTGENTDNEIVRALIYNADGKRVSLHMSRSMMKRFLKYSDDKIYEMFIGKKNKKLN